MLKGSCAKWRLKQQTLQVGSKVLSHLGQFIGKGYNKAV